MELRLRLGEQARAALDRRAIRERRTPNGEAEVLLLRALGLGPAERGEGVERQTLHAGFMGLRGMLDTRTDGLGEAMYRRRTSRHEAAHAVVSVLAGGSIVSMGLGAQHGGGGWTNHAPNDPLTKLRIVLAGPAIEVLDGERLDSGSTADVADANRYAREAGIDEATYNAELADVQEELSQHLRAVDELARELDQRGSLTGDEAEAILRVNGVVCGG